MREGVCLAVCFLLEQRALCLKVLSFTFSTISEVFLDNSSHQTLTTMVRTKPVSRVSPKVTGLLGFLTDVCMVSLSVILRLEHTEICILWSTGSVVEVGTVGSCMTHLLSTTFLYFSKTYREVSGSVYSNPSKLKFTKNPTIKQTKSVFMIETFHSDCSGWLRSLRTVSSFFVFYTTTVFSALYLVF